MIDALRKNSIQHNFVTLLIVVAIAVAVKYGSRILGFELGGPLSTIVVLGAIAMIVKYEGIGFAALGLSRPDSWKRALIIFLMAFAFTAFCGLLLLPYLQEVFGTGVSSDRFAYLEGDPVALAITIVTIAWLAAAFGEEVMFRGFVMPRLAAIFGGNQFGWFAAVVLQAFVFGWLHSETAGMITAGAIGFGYGLLFWLGMRNLWPLIVAHAIPDTISLIGIYQGG